MTLCALFVQRDLFTIHNQQNVSRQFAPWIKSGMVPSVFVDKAFLESIRNVDCALTLLYTIQVISNAKKDAVRIKHWSMVYVHAEWILISSTENVPDAQPDLIISKKHKSVFWIVTVSWKSTIKQPKIVNALAIY